MKTSKVKRPLTIMVITEGVRRIISFMDYLEPIAHPQDAFKNPSTIRALIEIYIKSDNPLNEGEVSNLLNCCVSFLSLDKSEKEKAKKEHFEVLLSKDWIGIEDNEEERINEMKWEW